MRGMIGEEALVGRTEKILTWAFVVACGLFYVGWSFTIAPGQAPDEPMRYLIVSHIVEHGALPVGTDPSLRDPLWGTSYAFQPILSYMIGAVFVVVAQWFGADATMQLHAARLVSVICGAGTVAVCVALGRRFFGQSPWRWYFPVAVALLPQFAFLNSYVNNDALGLFATSLVVLAWLRGSQHGWTPRESLCLGVALSICTLSYLNTYGFLLVSVALCAGERYLAWRKFSDRPAFWRQTGVAVAIVVGTWLVLAGWWFVRNAILYDGDFLGLSTMSASIEMYGKPEIHADMRSGRGRGWTFFEMVFLRYWMVATLMSIVGMFGYMIQWLPLFAYGWYGVVWGISILGCVGWIIASMVPRWRNWLAPRVWSILPGLDGARRRLVVAALLVAGVIPWLLSLQRSWTQDFQPQGRYVLPMLVPMMFFVVCGLSWLVERIVPRWRTPIAVALLVPIVAIAVHALLFVVH